MVQMVSEVWENEVLKSLLHGEIETSLSPEENEILTSCSPEENGILTSRSPEEIEIQPAADGHSLSAVSTGAVCEKKSSMGAGATPPAAGNDTRVLFMPSGRLLDRLPTNHAGSLQLAAVVT